LALKRFCKTRTAVASVDLPCSAASEFYPAGFLPRGRRTREKNGAIGVELIRIIYRSPDNSPSSNAADAANRLLQNRKEDF
jgi:hypothetical protein